MNNNEALQILKSIQNLVNVLIEAMAPPPAAPPAPGFTCMKCGSRSWNPGGMGDLYKKCASCGEVGDLIDPKP